MGDAAMVAVLGFIVACLLQACGVYVEKKEEERKEKQ